MAGTHVGAAVVALDPTTQPAPGSFWVFLFMAVMLVLLLLSMLRHLRRAQENLGGPGASAQAPVEPAAAERTAAVQADREDDSR